MRMELSWKKTWSVLGLILVLGFGARAYGLGNNSFVADEFLDMNSAYGYFQTGEWKAWDFNHGAPSQVNANDARDERANIYKWQVAQLFHILPPTEATARIVSVFWGLVSMLVVFWSTLVFTRRKEIALLATLLFAVSVAGIIFDRRLRMYAMFTPVYLALATVIYQSFEDQARMRWCGWLQARIGVHPRYALLSAVLLVIGLSTHQLSAMVVFSVAAYLIVMGIREYRASGVWKNRYSGWLAFGIAGVAALGMVAPQFLTSFTSGLMWFDDHYSYVGYVMEDYAHPLLAVFLMGFGAYVIALRERQTKAAWYLTLSFLIPLAFAIWFFRRNAGPQYIFFAQSFGLILSAAGVYGLWEILKERFSGWGRHTALIVLIGLVLLVPNFGYFLEENNTYHETSSGGNPNYRKVFEYFRKNQLPTDVLVTRNFRNYYWSGTDVTVYDLGDEIHRGKLSREALSAIVLRHPSGWVVLSDNDYDYFSNEAEELMKRDMERVSNPSVRGPIEVYRWGHK
ncbi:MAG: hypothetical protein KA731_02145 [Candidatus Moranbacteria bacterium]|nr:hypothetical protein [Candidatus Moranbacteria bacterium]MBP6034356.1 hypothetical protein [Candidatus Moranbacteria bacterium]MBP7696076.1 hypothetical protein [Candidatus Moranbacteria bacterium]